MIVASVNSDAIATSCARGGMSAGFHSGFHSGFHCSPVVATPHGHSLAGDGCGRLAGLLLDSLLDRLAYPVAELLSINYPPIPHVDSRSWFRAGTAFRTSEAWVRFTPNLPRGRRIA